MTEPTLRQLSLDDYDALLALWREAGLHSIRPAGRDSRESVARQLATGVQTILGLELNGALVGTVLVTHDSRKGWINRLAVHPDHRRKGYALRLIEAAERQLREQHIHIFAALIESGNLASLSLFRDAGYVEVDRNMHYLSKRDRPDV